MSLLFLSCEKNDETTTTSSKIFEYLTFNTTNAYFSTDGSMTSPVDSNQAKTISDKGSCIGGRQTDDPTSITLSEGQVFVFKNTASGKRGLLYIRTDQYTGWPLPVYNANTKVDIIREY